MEGTRKIDYLLSNAYYVLSNLSAYALSRRSWYCCLFSDLLLFYGSLINSSISVYVISSAPRNFLPSRKRINIIL